MSTQNISVGVKPADADDGLAIVVSPDAPTGWFILFTAVGTADVRMTPAEMLKQFAFSEVFTGPLQTVRCNAAGTAVEVEPKMQTLTDAATVAWDAALGRFAKVTLAGNRTLGKPTNLQEGDTLMLTVIQDGTGSRTLSYHADYLFPDAGTAPTLSTAADSVDVLSFAAVTIGGTLSLLFTGIRTDYQ